MVHSADYYIAAVLGSVKRSKFSNNPIIPRPLLRVFYILFPKERLEVPWSLVEMADTGMPK